MIYGGDFACGLRFFPLNYYFFGISCIWTFILKGFHSVGIGVGGYPHPGVCVEDFVGIVSNFHNMKTKATDLAVGMPYLYVS